MTEPSNGIWTPQGSDDVHDYNLIPAGSGRIDVSNTGEADITGPDLTSFSGLPATADVAAGSVRVSLAFGATDDFAGPGDGKLELVGGTVTLSLGTFTAANFSGGAYIVDTAIPADSPPGFYQVLVTLRDAFGNTRLFGPGFEDMPGGATSAVEVRAGPADYASWSATQDFGPGAQSGQLKDPNGDGTPNLLCYAFNLPPYTQQAHVLTPVTGTVGLPSITTVGTGSGRQLRIEFLRRIGTTDLVYHPQFCSSLGATGPGAWKDATITETPVVIDTNWERVVVLDPVAGAGARFGRVVVETAVVSGM